MELLAGHFDEDRQGAKSEKPEPVDVADAEAESEHSLASLGISYKKQNYGAGLRKFEGVRRPDAPRHAPAPRAARSRSAGRARGSSLPHCP